MKEDNMAYYSTFFIIVLVDSLVFCHHFDSYFTGLLTTQHGFFVKITILANAAVKYCFALHLILKAIIVLGLH